MNRFAAIDIGSNSIRMVIGEVSADGRIEVLERLHRAARLGQDTFRRGRLGGWAAGVSGLFMETHPDPDQAKSDGPNAWPLPRMRELLETLLELDRVVQARGFAEAAS